ncbi:MAG: thioredoxin reductase (NADPH) [Candidatus Magnetoglobus multicellularis str. Araruama]|uniref:Thioredoxin reductase n=1 Tax=Candidatus Magnetoglobus multicellularis str. Araruama TaxID=890399 RepID=A0A1V1P6F5_9BACT|nr:MAG: thioredoxin reductase (NADPH) [Candidatus Magnetoglobus multicellularis str. Araruama]
MDYDLIIIGGGPGGMTAGIYAMRATVKTLLIEKGAFGGQMTMTDTVENYPGFDSINGFDLSQKFFDHAKKFDLETTQQEVISVQPIEPHGYAVSLSNGKTYQSLAVILACGGRSRNLGIPGESQLYGRGVSYCATCDGFFYRNKTVAVIGGGDTAVEEALYLAKLAQKVYLLHRRDELRAGAILKKRLLAEPKVEILWNTIPVEIKDNGQTVDNLVYKNKITNATQTLPVDGVFIFIGYIPNNAIVPETIKRTDEGYIITDTRCRTALDGLYAIGDLRDNYAKQIVIAAADGSIAALDAAQYIEHQKNVS